VSDSLGNVILWVLPYLFLWGVIWGIYFLARYLFSKRASRKGAEAQERFEKSARLWRNILIAMMIVGGLLYLFRFPGIVTAD